jgi:hypothetical protein
MGKRWIFREVDWQLWRDGKLPEQERIVKRDIGNFKLESTIENAQSFGNLDS